VNLGVVSKHPFRFPSEFFHILAVFQNRQPFAMFMRTDPIEALQHLITFDKKSTTAGVVIRQNSAPHRMRMENGSGTPGFNDGNMQQRFGRRLTRSGVQSPAAAIDLENLAGREPAFIDGTCGNG